MFHFDKIQQKLFLIMAFLIVLLAGALIFREYTHNFKQAAITEQPSWQDSSGEFSQQSSNQKPQDEITDNIIIYLVGQVKNPGIIRAAAGDRLADAIDLAGGLLPDADNNRINLAIKLKDEGKYYIPQVGEEAPSEYLGMGDNFGDEIGKININTADQKLLETLNNIGPARAQRIIDYRIKNNGFKAIEELKNVSGIGDKIFDGLKEQICIE